MTENQIIEFMSTITSDDLKNIVCFPSHILKLHSVIIQIVLEHQKEPHVKIPLPFPTYCFEYLHTLLIKEKLPPSLSTSNLSYPLSLSKKSLNDFSNSPFPTCLIKLLDSFSLEEFCVWCNFLNALELKFLFDVSCMYVALQAHKNPVSFFSLK